MTIDTLPINWHPEWPGVCDCGTQSLYVMCLLDDETHAIEMYDTWAKCSWCGKDWTIRIPNDDN